MLKLRVHALLISVSLLILVVLLGARAFSVAHQHSSSIQALASQELDAHSTLVRMEGLAASRDQALKKLQITLDPSYATLAAFHRTKLAKAGLSLESVLVKIYPEFRGISDQLESTRSLKELHDQLNERRQKRLQDAREAALGLARLILLALILTIGVTSWLLTLFYRGLIQPLNTLSDATSRIRQGELSHRIPKKGSKLAVSELQDLSSSFNAMAERLETLDHAKTEFFQAISHEIKNPLAAIKEGLVFLATRHEQLSPTSREKAFAACMIAAKRLESMINNLLHHSRSESGAGFYDFEMTPHELTPALDSAIEEVRLLARKKSMQIRRTGAAHVTAAFNFDGMVHVLVNLLTNAIKYGRENSSIEVHVDQSMPHTGKPLPQIEISVSNSGAEIPESERFKIFERFYRGSNSTSQQGLGLGLHVVKKIVEAHNGQIVALSKNEQTRFLIQIPGRYETEAIAVRREGIC